MKKILVLLLLCAGSLSYAQQEIKINMTDALALKTLNLSYEQYLTDQTSFGASALFNFEGENSDFRYNHDEMFTAYVRHYLPSETLWTLFGEVFFAYNQGEDKEENIVTEFSDGALGIAVGYKYVSNGGFTIGTHIGLGRNLFSKTAPSIVPRIGLNLGFQFGARSNSVLPD